jgi:hypothetical protein
MTPTQLSNIDDVTLIQSFKKAAELNAKNDGNGKSPFDIDQLYEEIIKRMNANK